MSIQGMLKELSNAETMFNRSTECFAESDSSFRIAAATRTVAHQVAHVAHTVEWFVAGAFDPKGFDTDWAAQEAKIEKVKSLAEARAWLARAFESARKTIGAKSEAEMAKPIAAGEIMGGAPRLAVISGIVDHTAHHRGYLAACARAAGKVPGSPYA